jgi:L-ascorbate metabolism protein UlaG (beta-lactamase superfamily)
MNIIWYGETCFQITSQTTKDNPVKIVIDPLKDGSGFKMPKLEADILIDSSGKINLDKIKGDPFAIDGPGEFDIKGVFAQGVEAPQKENAEQKEKSQPLSVAYILETEGVRVCHLGSLGAQDINSNGVMDKIGDVDILMISVGGGSGFTAQEAASIAKQIDPRIIVPMLYKYQKASSSLESVDNFLKIMGKKNIEPISKLSIKKIYSRLTGIISLCLY